MPVLTVETISDLAPAEVFAWFYRLANYKILSAEEIEFTELLDKYAFIPLLIFNAICDRLGELREELDEDEYEALDFAANL
jgi:hypothetical protein